jgi:aldehyde oxidoreductase
MTSFLCNGRTVEVGEHPHLLAALREELDITSPKDGCAPEGRCGCCTVLLDGRAVLSCRTPLARVEGRSVITLEGLPEDERHRLADAFAATGALQCGFCTPGILVRTVELLDRYGADLTRDQAVTRLGAHLCRCTGYVSILDAIEALAQGSAGPPTLITGIGSGGARYEATVLALGDRGYVADLRVPGMLHGALRLADHARAELVAIDTSRAAGMPGVVAVLTAADVPGELRVGLLERDWPVFVPAGGRTSYLGDVLAMVVAQTQAQARMAADAVEVATRPLTPVTDPLLAMADDAEPAVWGTSGNILSVSNYRRGDAAAALATSAHVVREVFATQRVEQAYLEPEATLAVPDGDGGLHVYSGGQGVWDDRDQLAEVLGVAPERITVELVSNGGAFGGKEDLSNQAQTALAAWVTGRPVVCVLTREQSLRMHPKRHPIRLAYEVGCDVDGRLTGLRARLVGDTGAYASVGAKVLERAAGHAAGPYVIPAVDVEAVAVRTNNPVCGAFRGFGVNQASFAVEGALERLAEQVGLDPWELRRRNVIVPGSVWGPGQVMDAGASGALACLEAIRPHYERAREAGAACGLALAMKNSGLGNGARELSRATVRFDPDGTLEVRHCWTEMGQGVHSVAVAVACEELGVTADRVRVVVDTSRELGAGQTTGSRGTLLGAGAVRDACVAARDDGCRPGVEYGGSFLVDWTDAIEDGVEHPTIHAAFGYACHLVVLDEDGEVARVVAAHDVGRAVNPTLCRGQVEGSVHMGLGYALSEDFPADDQGRPLHLGLGKLGILPARAMPPVETILLEHPQPGSPYGVKGIGEIGSVPTAPAVAAALHARDGRWRARLPLRPPTSGRVPPSPARGSDDEP